MRDEHTQPPVRLPEPPPKPTEVAREPDPLPTRPDPLLTKAKEFSEEGATRNTLNLEIDDE